MDKNTTPDSEFKVTYSAIQRLSGIEILSYREPEDSSFRSDSSRTLWTVMTRIYSVIRGIAKFKIWELPLDAFAGLLTIVLVVLGCYLDRIGPTFIHYAYITGIVCVALLVLEGIFYFILRALQNDYCLGKMGFIRFTKTETQTSWITDENIRLLPNTKYIGDGIYEIPFPPMDDNAYIAGSMRAYGEIRYPEVDENDR